MTDCPHCGAALSGTVDAFCPECREPLDERPASLAALIERGPEVVRKSTASPWGALCLLAGGLGLLASLVAVFAGEWGAGLMRGIWSVALIAYGASRPRGEAARAPGPVMTFPTEDAPILTERAPSADAGQPFTDERLKNL